MTRAPAPLLEIEQLSIRFGGLAALSEVDLAVGAGEIFALIGPNGAGKTTVFNVLTGLYRPSGGRVRFDGHDLLARAPHAVARLGVARTFQNTEVFRGLSALDNVLIGAHARLRGHVIAAALGLPGVRREEAHARERARALLARVGLGDAAGRDAAGLPLGLQKRVELARALALEPRLLLLDEPAGGLNPTETQELMRLIRSLRERRPPDDPARRAQHGAGDGRLRPGGGAPARATARGGDARRGEPGPRGGGRLPRHDE